MTRIADMDKNGLDFGEVSAEIERDMSEKTLSC